MKQKNSGVFQKPVLKISGIALGMAFILISHTGVCQNIEVNSKKGSLLGWWQFDEAAGSKIQDSSSQSNHGVMAENSGCRTNGRIGGGLAAKEILKVNAANITLGADTMERLRMSSEITLELWIKWEASSEGSGCSAVYGCPRLWIYGDGRLLFAIGPITAANHEESNNFLISRRILKKDVWHHIACVFNKGTMFIYIDGEMDVSKKTPNKPAFRSEMAFGGFKGTLDEARLYSRALGAEEVKRHAVLDESMRWEYIEDQQK